MVNIAILGFGTVGSGVAEVIEENRERIAGSAGEEICVKYIVDIRDMPDSPFASRLIRDFSVVESDPEVSVVVETIGGTRAALEFTRRALSAGKSVVTSNKELVAAHGLELLAIAKEKNVNYLFEASVGGGIPIISPITQCLTANEIDEVYGILNGTTNYILTRMIAEGCPFDEVLREAQRLGYAEADPTADVEGYDAARKICILADLCFGKNVDPEAIRVEGISGISLTDVDCAGGLGYKIKLLGRAYRLPDGRVTAYVAPHLISDKYLISRVDGVMNGIVVHGNALGECLFYGAGAGKRPTASAVVADVIDAVKHRQRRRTIGWEPADGNALADARDMATFWYVRCAGSPDVRALNPRRTLERGGERVYLTGSLTARELDAALGPADVRAKFRIL